MGMVAAPNGVTFVTTVDGEPPTGQPAARRGRPGRPMSPAPTAHAHRRTGPVTARG